jgi:hypothetical protein
VLLAAVSGLVVMLALPQPPAPGTADGEVVAWPARGSLAGDGVLARQASRAWREAAERGRVPAPGPEVSVLYAGPTGPRTSVVLRSSVPGAGTLVALAHADGDRPRVVSAQPVESSPRAVVLAGEDGYRLLLPPPPSTVDLVVRRADGIWQWLDTPPDGMTAPVRGLDGRDPVLGVVSREFGQPALVETSLLTPTSLLPAPDTVEVVAPLWGRTSPESLEEYDQAAATTSALMLTDPGVPLQVAVLAATGPPADRTVVVELPRAAGPADRVGHVLVHIRSGSTMTGPAPLVGDALAVGVLPRSDGRTLVLVGSSPEVARVDVSDSAGRPLVSGAGAVSVVLPAPAPSGLVVVGTRPDGTQVERLQVAVRPGVDDTGDGIPLVAAAGGTRGA